MKSRRFLVTAFLVGTASKFIRPFRLRPGDRVLILARKSGCERGNNLDDQVANLRRVVEAAGAIVEGIYKYQGSGWNPEVSIAAY